MTTALVTGANGFIGSHLVLRLLAKGWRVHALGRSAGAAPWKQRVLSALQQVGSFDKSLGQLEFHEVDLQSCRPLPQVLLERCSRTDTMLIHVAGDTHFNPSDPDAQRKINVQAAVNLVSALKGRLSRVMHVSTAYVAGRRTGKVLESELDCGQGFWNSYEKSKYDAEAALTELCRTGSIPLVIVRPAIIVNDRGSGRASTFTHLNALVEVVSRLQDYYGLTEGEVVSKVIRLVADPNARPNLAPIDSILPPMVQIAESGRALGRVFHLCHPRPQTNAEVLGLIRDAYKVGDRLAIDFVNEIPAPLSRTEEMVARSLKVYAPYMNNRLEFDLRNSRDIVPEYDSYFSLIDLHYLQKVIDFQQGKHRERRRG